MKLIIPIAGKSSRFSNTRPKWMLTNPSGHLMVIDSILGLNLESFTNIYFVGLKKHEQKYCFSKGLLEQLNTLNLHTKSEIILIDRETSCQPDTVSEVIKIKKLSGFIFIKDSDNYFKAEVKPINQVCYFSLNEAGELIAKNKSYITKDSNESITSIVEKNVISPYFSVGGYGFIDCASFVNTYKESKQTLEDSKLNRSEVYTSDIIFNRMCAGDLFFARKVTDYLDWGTKDDWIKYRGQFATLFVDLDGVLVEHSSLLFPPYIGDTIGITNNIAVLRKYYEQGKLEIIITTSRPESYREITEEQLKKQQIPYDQLVMGLKHNKRIVINDYSNSNPYKSCASINLKRDSSDLESYIMEHLK